MLCKLNELKSVGGGCASHKKKRIEVWTMNKQRDQKDDKSWTGSAEYCFTTTPCILHIAHWKWKFVDCLCWWRTNRLYAIKKYQITIDWHSIGKVAFSSYLKVLSLRVRKEENNGPNRIDFWNAFVGVHWMHSKLGNPFPCRPILWHHQLQETCKRTCERLKMAGPSICSMIRTTNLH